jgi:O-antigen/teichoic acid export membrane protein
MAALAIASIFNFIYSYSVVRWKLKVSIKLLYDKLFIREILKISWPFAVFAIFQRLYTYLDSVLLSVLAGDVQVGLYQVAFKIIFALQFLPMAFTASLYPALSAYWQHNREQLAITFERAMNYLIIISLPIVFGIFILADNIVLLFKNDYSAAAWPLKISIISLFFIFLNFPIGSLLNACDAQRRNTRNMIIVTILSVTLNLFLIPEFKATGAAITVLATNALMFILGLRETNKIIGRLRRQNLLIFAKALIASAVMAALVFGGRNYCNIFLLTALGGVLYFFILFLLGGFKKADVLSVYNSFRRPKTL